MAEQPDPTDDDATADNATADNATAAPEDTDAADTETATVSEASDASDAEAETTQVTVPVSTTAAHAPAGAFTRAAAAARSGAVQRWLRVAVVAAVFLGAFALAGGLGYQLWRQHVVTRAGEEAQQTAVDYAAVLTSINSTDVDEDFTTVLNGATGDFKDMYTRASMELRELLLATDSGAEGVVIDSAIQSEAADQVVLLLMIDQKVTNAKMDDPRTDSLRMKMTMDKIDGRWLASKVELP